MQTDIMNAAALQVAWEITRWQLNSDAYIGKVDHLEMLRRNYADVQAICEQAQPEQATMSTGQVDFYPRRG